LIRASPPGRQAIAGSIIADDEISPAEAVNTGYRPALKDAFCTGRIEWIIIVGKNHSDANRTAIVDERYAIKSVVGRERRRPTVEIFNWLAHPSGSRGINGKCVRDRRGQGEK
jgi:hypothetical protein